MEIVYTRAGAVNIAARIFIYCSPLLHRSVARAGSEALTSIDGICSDWTYTRLAAAGFQRGPLSRRRRPVVRGPASRISATIIKKVVRAVHQVDLREQPAPLVPRAICGMSRRNRLRIGIVDHGGQFDDGTNGEMLAGPYAVKLRHPGSPELGEWAFISRDIARVCQMGAAVRGEDETSIFKRASPEF
jgi:hypothetical protein